MGQKCNPTGLRIGVIKNWDSRWYAKKGDFANTLVDDHNLREYLLNTLKSAGVPKIEIERDAKRVRINIHCAKPGMVIGKQGAEIEKRVSFRRAVKQAIRNTMRLGARGIKVQVSGRIGGAEIARTETYKEGTIPLQTIRADIDYGTAEAATTYGRIGVKVWIYQGEVLRESRNKAPRRRTNNNRRRENRKEGGNQ